MWHKKWAATVESGKKVTFFEQLFCFYQLVLVVWKTLGAKFNWIGFYFLSETELAFFGVMEEKIALPPLGGTFGGETGSWKNHFSGRGFSRLARLYSLFLLDHRTTCTVFRCLPCLPWQRWLIRVRTLTTVAAVSHRMPLQDSFGVK